MKFFQTSGYAVGEGILNCGFIVVNFTLLFVLFRLTTGPRVGLLEYVGPESSSKELSPMLVVGYLGEGQSPAV